MSYKDALPAQAPVLLEAATIAGSYMEPDERIEAVVRTRSGLPAILLLLVGIFTLGLVSFVLGIVWPSAIGRGFVILTDKRLLLVDAKSRALTLSTPAQGLQIEIRRRPLIDDLLLVERNNEVLRIHLASDPALLQAALANRNGEGTV